MIRRRTTSIWETSDGRQFASREEAHQHARFIILHSIISGQQGAAAAVKALMEDKRILIFVLPPREIRP